METTVWKRRDWSLGRLIHRHSPTIKGKREREKGNYLKFLVWKIGW